MVRGGADVLIGGLGEDNLEGGDDDDLLIGACTAFDDNRTMVGLIASKWSSGASCEDRVDRLRAGTGPILQGRTKLSVDGLDRTAFDNDQRDTLSGESGCDWFLASLDGESDEVEDVAANEFIDRLRMSPPQRFLVNSKGDGSDINLGDALCDSGDLVDAAPECTLRAAIEQANVAAKPTNGPEVCSLRKCHAVRGPQGDVMQRRVIPIVFRDMCWNWYILKVNLVPTFGYPGVRSCG